MIKIQSNLLHSVLMPCEQKDSNAESLPYCYPDPLQQSQWIKCNLVWLNEIQLEAVSAHEAEQTL